MWHVWEVGYVCTEFWWGKLREIDYSDELDVDDKIILKWIRGHGLVCSGSG
jgi:hypothetical protein